MNTKQLNSVFKMRGSSNVSYLSHSVDEMIYSFMAEKGISGLTLAIVQAPYIPRVVGYGVADPGRALLASPNTVYPLGPISQAFLAVAVMQLYEDKKLDVYAPLGRYLDVPEAWKYLPLISLLRHSSGLPDFRDEKGFDPRKEFDFAGILSLLKGKALLPESGFSYHESATDNYLLSEVVAKLSGMSYPAFVKKRQIDFLGLRHTASKEHLGDFVFEDVTKSANLHEVFKHDGRYIDPTELASSYDEKGKEIAKISASSLRGYSDIYASAQDVSYWDIALAGGVLIHEKANRDLVYAPWKNAQGDSVPAVAGWHFYHHRGLMAIRGNYPGFSSYLSRFTHSEELVCVTLLANKEGVDFTNLARKIAGAFGDYLSTNYDDNQLYLLESQFDAATSVLRLKKELLKRKIPLFAEIDHAQNAQGVGLTLLPNEVLIFGNPLAGTPLMVADASFGLDLPLKMGIFTDMTGSTFIAFSKTQNLAAAHGIPDDPQLMKMEILLESIAANVADL